MESFTLFCFQKKHLLYELLYDTKFLVEEFLADLTNQFKNIFSRILAKYMSV